MFCSNDTDSLSLKYHTCPHDETVCGESISTVKNTGLITSTTDSLKTGHFCSYRLLFPIEAVDGDSIILQVNELANSTVNITTTMNYTSTDSTAFTITDGEKYEITYSLETFILLQAESNLTSFNISYTYVNSTLLALEAEVAREAIKIVKEPPLMDQIPEDNRIIYIAVPIVVFFIVFFLCICCIEKYRNRKMKKEEIIIHRQNTIGFSNLNDLKVMDQEIITEEVRYITVPRIKHIGDYEVDQIDSLKFHFNFMQKTSDRQAEEFEKKTADGKDVMA